MYVYIYTYEVIYERRVNRRRGGEYIKEERREHVKPVARRIIRSDNSINRVSLSDSPTSVRDVVIIADTKGSRVAVLVVNRG